MKFGLLQKANATEQMAFLLREFFLYARIC